MGLEQTLAEAAVVAVSAAIGAGFGGIPGAFIGAAAGSIGYDAATGASHYRLSNQYRK
ncbi:hypothetical protein HYX02_04695 [Candidatus Woesearchaeota archaeon]|nr:hypothetical protein [Candidatus Woesearchaeota archaeon]